MFPHSREELKHFGFGKCFVFATNFLLKFLRGIKNAFKGHIWVCRFRVTDPDRKVQPTVYCWPLELLVCVQTHETQIRRSVFGSQFLKASKWDHSYKSDHKVSCEAAFNPGGNVPYSRLLKYLDLQNLMASSD
jgi:hypothetical protein